MIGQSLYLEARSDERNVNRAYEITVSLDLFGFVIVERRWGRVGSKLARNTARSFDNMPNAEIHVHSIITRRLNANGRIGVDYRLIETSSRS